MTVPVVALAVAVLGLLAQPRRWGAVTVLTLLAVAAFGGAALAPVATAFEPRAPVTVDLAIRETTAGTDLAAAAARVGPRAGDLTLTLAEPGATLPPGPLGATARLASEPLPFSPRDLSLRLLRRPQVGRPVALAVGIERCRLPVTAQVLVQAADAALCEQSVVLGPTPVTIEFTPGREGPHQVELLLELPGRSTRVSASGSFGVEPAPRALVLEAGDVFAAALEAQGIVVARAWPGDDLRGYAALLVGEPLAAGRQAAVAAALDDGLGVFVAAPAFGGDGEALHDLLPVRPEPVLADPGQAPGPGPPEPGPAEPTPPPEAPPPPSRAPPSGEIEDPSPIAPEPLEVDKRSIAMVLLIDRSGSMGERLADGTTAMSYAKTSALQTARALTKGDRVGIVSFGRKDAGRVELPMTDALDRAGIQARLESLQHGDAATFLLSGLRTAGRLVADEDAAVKQIVVISDGEFRMEQELALQREARELFRRSGVVTSIVTIGRLGPAFSRMAGSITREGGGRFWAADVAQGVPAIVSVEVTRALERAGRAPDGPGEGGADPRAKPPDTPPEPRSDPPPPPEPEPSAPETEPERPAEVVVRAVASSPVLEPEPADGWPVLRSAVPTTAPLDAQVLLVAGDEGWPLLAFANRGLGRIGAFAADLAGGAGQAWRDDPAFPARLALWVQHVMRAARAWQATAIPLATAIVPRAPTPEEVRALEACAGSAIATASADGSPTRVRLTRSLVPHFALGGLLGLLALALAERLARRRTAQPV